jgi:bifunctional DNA-binding transcriptional regulator/antitoxin component of YhaV-PrlF toxin-antitoxin module
MPTTSTKKPSTAKGGKPAKSGSTAKAAKSGQPAKGFATGRKGASGRKSVGKRAAGYRQHRSEGAFLTADAPTGMITSKLTVRDQTTLPPAVRQVLGLKAGQRLGYVFDSEGVRLVNPTTAAEHADPVLQQFLTLLGSHIAAGPAAGGAVAFPPDLLERARALTADVEIDHDAPIEGAMLI